MARSKRRKKLSSKAEMSRRSAELKRHVNALGLKSFTEYQAWCRKRGLSSGLYKSDSQKKKERQLARSQHTAALLARTHQHTRNSANTIQRFYRRELKKGRLGADYLYKIRHLFNDVAEGPERRALLELLLQAERHADLFHLDPVLSALGQHPRNNYLDALALLARQHARWVRPVQDWRPDSHNARRQFHHLTCHLLAQYDVPSFMDAAFFQGDAARAQQQWFIHIGSGQNIRTADIPISMSKKQAHAFLQAPDRLLIDQVLRWAQVTGQGGSTELAQSIVRTRLGQSFENEEFWSTVVLFFVRNPMLDPAHVGPIVDYIHHQKYEPHQVILPGGEVEERPPAQPNFSMKSRSIPKLLRGVEEWHEELARQIQAPEEAEGPAQSGKKSRARIVMWEHSSIDEFTAKEENRHSGERWTWSISELLSNRELAAEGKGMGHCVYTYAHSCRSGAMSIWSLRVKVKDGRGSQPVLTIALNPHTRTITQIRGRFNVLPTSKASESGLEKGDGKVLAKSQGPLQQWMKREGLTMGG